MSTSYDERIIQTMADTLYAQANSIVRTYTLLGLLVGGAGAAAALGERGTSPLVIMVAALVSAAVGFQMAQPKAFALRLQAQQALCQLQIERNTRDRAA